MQVTLNALLYFAFIASSLLSVSCARGIGMLNALSTRGGSSGTTTNENVEVIVLDYEDLVNGVDLTDKIAEAYGKDGIGLLTVQGVPGLKQARSRLLPLAQKFAVLPEETQSKYEDVKSSYSFGWSMGKEKLEGGKPDLSKGSFYANPQYDKPVDDVALVERYPAFLGTNIWPSEEDCPDFEDAFKSLGQLIVDVGLLVSQQVDAYVRKVAESYEEGKLHRIVKTSLCCKARLLHYFTQDGGDGGSKEEVKEGDFSSWCGWHNDHGSLTGLTSAMYLDKDGNEAPNRDSSAGLYIKGRKGQLVKAAFPADRLAFQIGETAQIHSGGILQATPHAVRGSSDPSVTRETFAVFMEPNWDEIMSMPDGMDIESAQGKDAESHLPNGVPVLRSRWSGNKQDFGSFTEETIKAYYQ
jgi:isopenicillin N synthase-like dioxygenase